MRAEEIEQSLLGQQAIARVASAPRRESRGQDFIFGEDHTELPRGTSTTLYEMIGRRVGMEVSVTSHGDKIDVMVKSRDGHGTVPFWREYEKHHKRGPVKKLIAAVVWEVRNRIAPPKQPAPVQT